MSTYTVDGITWNYTLSGTSPNQVASIGTGNTNGNATTQGTGLSGVITIPSTVGTQNYPVTAIGQFTFNYCPDITSVTIPDSVTTIDTYAFFFCGLTSITIGNSVTFIGISAFQKCTGLTSINIPDSVTTIDNYAFRNCTGLTSITIPDSVTSIGGNTFLETNTSLIVTMNTKTFGTTTYTSPTTTDIPFFGNASVTLVLPPEPPSMTIASTTTGVTSGSTTNNPSIALTFTSSEATIDFVVGDITVTNGTLSAFAGSGTGYTATFTPTGQGACTIDISAGVYTDAATNLNNLATQFNWTFDLLAGGLSIAELIATGISIADLVAAGVTVADLLAGGLSIAELIATGISIADLVAAGVTQTQIDIALANIKIQSDFTISDGTNSSVFVTESISPNNPLNSPNVFESTDAKTSTPQKWQDIEISSTGQYQIAVVGGYTLSTGHILSAAVTGNVWISTDYGETWLEKTGIDQVSGAEKSWINACISADGAVMMVKAMGNLVYRSENGGVSWTQKTITNFTERVSSGWDGRPYYNLLMASDGQRVIIGTYNNVQTKMMISTDGGTNWADLTSLSSEYEYIIDYHMSKSGKYILVMFNNSTRPKYSDDFGATFITITDTNLSLTTTTNYIMHLYSRGVCAISDNGYAIISDYNVQINTINLTTGTVSNNAYDGTWVTHTTTEFPWAVCISKNGKYMIVHLRQNGTYVNTMYISSDYGTSFTVADINEFYVGYKQVTFNSINLNSRCFATRFSDDNKYIAAIQEGDHIYVRKNTFIQNTYTLPTFADKLTTDLGYTVTAGGDLTATDSTPYYRLYLQFANAVTLTGMPKYIFNIPFSDFSVGAGGQVNLRNVNLDAQMTIATSYDTTSNTSTIPAGNYFINNFVSTIETDLVDYTLSYDGPNKLITLDGLTQDISMSITSTDTTVFDTSMTEITVAANTLPFITYGQTDPTFSQYNANGITTSEFVSNGYTIPQLLIGGFIPDWTFDTDANHLAQSYVKDFIDISGSLALRENASLTVNGNIETKGNVTIKNLILEADLSLNHNIFVVGDISMNGNVTVGDVSMNGKVVDCSFTDSSIPESAFIGTIPSPDYTQPTIMYEKGFDTTADVSMNANVQINNLKVDGNIEFSDGTTMNTKSIGTFNDRIPMDPLDITSYSNTVTYPITFSGMIQSAMSANGQFAIFTSADTNGIYITINSGGTWVNKLANRCNGVAISRNGKHMLCSLAYSHDYGETWTNITLTGSNDVNAPDLNSGCISDNGNYMYIGTNKSSDGGITWTTFTTLVGTLSTQLSHAICCSGNGESILFAGLNPNYIYRSDDYGGTWDITESDSTSKFYVTCNSDFSSLYYLSGGWRQGHKYNTTTNVWDALALTDSNSTVMDYVYMMRMSPNGKYIMLNGNNGNNHPFSSDYGVTWSRIEQNVLWPTEYRVTSHNGFAEFPICIGDDGSIMYYGTALVNGVTTTGIHTMNVSHIHIDTSTFTSLTISNTLTAGSFSTSSDYRIKTDVSQLDETITLDNLRPVKYLQTLINKPQYGFIAHELQEYYPDLVVGEKDGEEWQRVNYTGLVALLINEIKQLKRELTELENGM
jgi:hypothetical protein